MFSLLLFVLFCFYLTMGAQAARLLDGYGGLGGEENSGARCKISQEPIKNYLQKKKKKKYSRLWVRVRLCPKKEV